MLVIFRWFLTYDIVSLLSSWKIQCNRHLPSTVGISMVVQLAQQVLVVPPFECAWLTGENYLLRNGKGCISFEVKGKYA
jgi:hypothetical protein